VIILDTSVFSEAMRPEPHEHVAAWLEGHGAELVTTSITVSELRFGAARLPQGVRKRTLEAALDASLAGVTVLPFGEPEVVAYARIRAAQEAAGVAAGALDVQIAAIAAVGGHSLATRNVKHFERAGITVIDPWVEH